MQGAPERGRMTYADLLALPDDGMRHEIIDGEHYVTPAPSWSHQLILGNLYRIIAPHVRQRALGTICMAPLDVVLSRHDVVEPDVLFFTTASFKKHARERNADGPPDLAIEILSPSTRRRDQVIKRRLYERVGVGEYWIVDPKLKAVTVLRLAAGSYQVSELTLADGAVLASPLFPGLTVPLADVFELPFELGAQ